MPSLFLVEVGDFCRSHDADTWEGSLSYASGFIHLSAFVFASMTTQMGQIEARPLAEALGNTDVTS